jgi:tRNA dimethylallyltransferase
MSLRVQTGAPAMPPAIFLMGPTASGKTGLAVELHQRFPLDVISVDSAMVYRGMDIGTAKPDAATLARAPHRLIDIREPSESYSAAEFRQDALREMAAISSAGRIPLLVGGTMLYFRALSQGLAQLPKASPEVRKRLETQAQIIGWAGLHRQLEQLDPAAAKRIHPNDPQRIQRALEVIEVSGRKMSELQNEHRMLEEEQCGYRILRLIVCPSERLTLHQNIEKRFQNMLEQGFINEVRGLRRRGDLTPELPSMRCVGYRQVWSYLEDELDQQLMIRKAVAATRQLAKRQLTWLRQQPAALWYDLALDSGQESVLRDVAAFLES